MSYTIGEAAALFNIKTSVLRYYEQEGLLPFIRRSVGGKRVFEEADIGWILLINCLKKAGLPIKQIKAFVELTKQGDSTIKKRQQLFQKQHEEVKKQLASLQEVEAVLQYKCWFYETAEKLGSTAAAKAVPEKEIPEHLRHAYKKLQKPLFKTEGTEQR